METASKTVNVKSIKDLRRFRLQLLDIEKFVEVNSIQKITNPIYFAKPGIPTSDGLLSNEIFGITKEERSGTYGYIDLGDYFIHPLVYKHWSRLDTKIRECIHGTTLFSIDENGYLVEDPNGSCGINFLRDNFNKINIKRTASLKRDLKINFINNNKNLVFIKKMPVIPAFYRDKDTSSNTRVKITNSNSLYQSLIMATNGLRETAEYGIQASNAVKGRIQEILLSIYDWFTQDPNLSKKTGIIKRAGMSKTTDYASRIVISAPNLKVERWEDLTVTMDYSYVPLESVCANFFPFMIFAVRRFFESEFSDDTIYRYYDHNGNLQILQLKDPLIEFSDERIKEEIERFIKGFANRLVPIYIPNEGDKPIHMRFKGRNINYSSIKNEIIDSDKLGIIDRPLTWCDVLYMCACEVVQNKTILITRYPYDSYYSQFPTKIHVACMKNTERIYLNGQIYNNYPKIRQEDIGKNTSNMFVSTLNISNLYLAGINGDYDGDQVTIKGLYFDESNKEQMDLINSKSHYLSLNGLNIRSTTNEGIQALYNLTKKLPDSKITKPKFKTKPLYTL